MPLPFLLLGALKVAGVVAGAAVAAKGVKYAIDNPEKVMNGVSDLVASAGNKYANKVDSMSDEELEDRSLDRLIETGNFNDYKTADEQREMAAKAREFYNKRKNN